MSQAAKTPDGRSGIDLGFDTLDDLDVAGRRVLVRVDLNVPRDGDHVRETARIERIRDTIEELAGQGAKVVLEQSTGAHLEFKIGIGSGPIRLCHLGGKEGKWHLLLKGKGFGEAVFAEGSAKPGDTIVSPSTYEYLDGEGVKARRACSRHHNFNGPC